MTFAEKNANRRAGRSNGTRAQQIEARRLRRLSGGAFGNAGHADWNDRVYGTTGAPR